MSKGTVSLPAPSLPILIVSDRIIGENSIEIYNLKNQ